LGDLGADGSVLTKSSSSMSAICVGCFRLTWTTTTVPEPTYR
jgi:hypothetical protein